MACGEKPQPEKQAGPCWEASEASVSSKAVAPGQLLAPCQVRLCFWWPW